MGVEVIPGVFCIGGKIGLVEMSELIQGSYDTWDVGDAEDI